MIILLKRCRPNKYYMGRLKLYFKKKRNIYKKQSRHVIKQFEPFLFDKFSITFGLHTILIISSTDFYFEANSI